VISRHGSSFGAQRCGRDRCASLRERFERQPANNGIVSEHALARTYSFPISLAA
jgi:hypothetical protein